MLNTAVRRIFTTGLVVVIPAGLSIYILYYIFSLGMGVVFTGFLIFLCGFVTTSYLGNKLVLMGERIAVKRPLTRSICQVKEQIAQCLFKNMMQSVKVLIVDYPCPDVYSIGFSPGHRMAIFGSAWLQNRFQGAATIFPML